MHVSSIRTLKTNYYRMKKIFYIFVFVIVTLISCERDDVVKSDNAAVIENIKSNAVALSNAHDSLVVEMLKLEKQKVLQKAKSTNKDDSKLNMNEMFDVIEQVTGVKPIILEAYVSNAPENLEIKINKINTFDNSYVLDLDHQFISISDYANSAITKKYLMCIDTVLQDSEYKSYDMIVSEINKIQQEIVTDMYASQDDIQLVLNSTEVLKGSLKIWDNVLPIEMHQVKGNKLMVSNALNWPRWLKWVFIGAADAVGGTISWFSGATIKIMGVPIYLPPGPVGAAGGAAAVSVIATIIAFQ